MKIYSPNYGFLISNISHLDRNNLRSHKSKKEKKEKRKKAFLTEFIFDVNLAFSKRSLIVVNNPTNRSLIAGDLEAGYISHGQSTLKVCEYLHRP